MALCVFNPFNSHDLFINSPLYLIYNPLLISYKSLVLDQDKNFFAISFSILITCLLDMFSYYWGNFHVSH